MSEDDFKLVPRCREPVSKKWAQLDSIPEPITAGSFVCKGILQARNVLVAGSEEIYFLNYKGNFGTRILPKRQSRNVIIEPQTTEQNRHKRRKIWIDESGNNPLCSNTKVKLNVVYDKNNAEEETTVMDKPYPLSELLKLEFLDSFYLMHVLECLIVYNDNQDQLDINSFWKICCERDTNFIPTYVTYCHFRRKGWVVKNGLKFGANLLLYKCGPAYYHASYSILIQTVTSDMSTSDPYFPTEELNWTNILAWNRTTEHVSKELLICYVVRPENITKDGLNSPNCLSSFKVQEVLIKRWKSSEEREQDGDC